MRVRRHPIVHEVVIRFHDLALQKADLGLAPAPVDRQKDGHDEGQTPRDGNLDQVHPQEHSVRGLLWRQVEGSDHGLAEVLHLQKAHRDHPLEERLGILLEVRLVHWWKNDKVHQDRPGLDAQNDDGLRRYPEGLGERLDHGLLIVVLDVGIRKLKPHGEDLDADTGIFVRPPPALALWAVRAGLHDGWWWWWHHRRWWRRWWWRRRRRRRRRWWWRRRWRRWWRRRWRWWRWWRRAGRVVRREPGRRRGGRWHRGRWRVWCHAAPLLLKVHEDALGVVRLVRLRHIPGDVLAARPIHHQRQHVFGRVGRHLERHGRPKDVGDLHLPLRPTFQCGPPGLDELEVTVPAHRDQPVPLRCEGGGVLLVVQEVDAALHQPRAEGRGVDVRFCEADRLVPLDELLAQVDPVPRGQVGLKAAELVIEGVRVRRPRIPRELIDLVLIVDLEGDVVCAWRRDQIQGLFPEHGAPRLVDLEPGPGRAHPVGLAVHKEPVAVPRRDRAGEVARLLPLPVRHREAPVPVHVRGLQTNGLGALLAKIRPSHRLVAHVNHVPRRDVRPARALAQAQRRLQAKLNDHRIVCLQVVVDGVVVNAEELVVLVDPSLRDDQVAKGPAPGDVDAEVRPVCVNEQQGLVQEKRVGEILGLFQPHVPLRVVHRHHHLLGARLGLSHVDVLLPEAHGLPPSGKDGLVANGNPGAALNLVEEPTELEGGGDVGGLQAGRRGVEALSRHPEGELVLDLVGNPEGRVDRSDPKSVLPRNVAVLVRVPVLAVHK